MNTYLSSLRGRLLYLIIVVVFLISSVGVFFIVNDVNVNALETTTSEDNTDSLGEEGGEDDSQFDEEFLSSDDSEGSVNEEGIVESEGIVLLYSSLTMYEGESRKVVDGDLSNIEDVECSGNITLSSDGNLKANSIGEGVVKYGGDVLEVTVVESSAPKVSLSTYIASAKMTWDSIQDVTGYEIWRKSSSASSYSKYSTVSATSKSLPVYTTKYYYKVRSFIKDSEGNVSYGNFSSVVSVVKPTISLSTNTRVINGVKYYKVTNSAIQLKWNKVNGAVKYRVYRYSPSKKAYLTYKTIDNGSTTTLSVTSLSSSTKYSFKVRAYDSNGNYITSSAYARYTRSKTDGYFYNRVVWYNVWKGVLISSSKASNTTMSNFKSNGKKLPVKYNYCTENNTLYIHAYVNIHGNGENKYYKYYKLNSSGNCYLSSTSSLTYREVIIKAIKDYWSKSVTGCSYDFITGCNFKTVVVLHESGYGSDQNIVDISIGNSDSKEYLGKYYWFFACASCSYSDKKAMYSGWWYDVKMKIPTQEQLKSNGSSVYRPELSMESYKSCVAHEFGHCLGLDDAYTSYINGSPLYRVSKSSEVGYYVDGAFRSIMYGSRDVHVVDNDIEMALQASGEASDNKPYSWQSFKTYTNSSICRKSSVIRK